MSESVRTALIAGGILRGPRTLVVLGRADHRSGLLVYSVKHFTAG